MWFSAIKLAAQAGSHIFKNRQRTKMLMADAQMRHAEKMANGEGGISGQIIRIKKFGLERRIHFIIAFGSNCVIIMGSVFG